MYKYLIFLFLFACLEQKSKSTFNSNRETPHGFRIQDNMVYYGTYAIPEADPTTFKILSQFYGKDARSVFWGYEKIMDADAESFEYLSFEYARDKARVYNWGDELPGFDAASFTVMDLGLLRDKNHVVYRGVTLAEADPETLLQKTDSWDFIIFSDKNSAFCFDVTERKFTRLVIPDPRNLRRLFPAGRSSASYDFYTNGIEVFLKDCTLVPGADARNFFELGDFSPYFGDKKSQVYFYATPVLNVNALAFKVFEGNFAKDDSSAFYSGKKIPEADAGTFDVTCRKYLQNSLLLNSPSDYCGGLVGRDKNRVFDPNDSASWTEP